MADVHIGSWGLPDFGITEWIGSKLGSGTTSQGGSDIIPNKPSAQTPTTTPTTQKPGPVYGPPAPTRTSGGGGAGGGSTTTSQPDQGMQNIDQARQSQEDAARAAAEASRQAAMRKYNAQKQIAEGAKGTAKGQYDWIISELGSNKQDLLDKVALNEKQGIENYTTQETKTKQQYDSARQEILSTYRDLNLQQEKLMRGSGQGQSSRSQEATMRLNNLMGKDLSNISTNEADSLALIGNALTQFKENTLNTKNSIERETKSKQDKATLDYNAQIQAIDNNMMLNENEREDAYAAAESKLAGDIANINTWAAGQKLEYQKTQAALKQQFDDYIVQMTDSNGLLNAGLGEKTSATNALLEQMGFTPLQTETSLDNITGGVYQKSTSYKSKEQLDQALASGQLSPLEYSQQIAALQRAPGAETPGTRVMAGGVENPTQRITSRDPLLSAIFA